jgi:hypothetical protein
MTLWTTPRNNSDHSAARQRLLQSLNLPIHRQRRPHRGQTVEPLQGVVKDLCALDRCWRRGQRHHRWLCAAMGVAVPRQQGRAHHAQRATGTITQEVVGLSKRRDPSTPSSS